MNEQTQTAIKWIASALNDYAATMPPSVREAFAGRAQAAVNQVVVGATTSVEPSHEVAEPAPRRGRKPRAETETPTAPANAVG